ncbi:MAG: hypothetical protein QGI63_09520 [Rhodospirillales bacterium]|nr:hypothetical protein [Rhodospirillales bacterium]
MIERKHFKSFFVWLGIVLISGPVAIVSFVAFFLWSPFGVISLLLLGIPGIVLFAAAGPVKIRLVKSLLMTAGVSLIAFPFTGTMIWEAYESLDDGPFKGTAREHCPPGVAQQIFPIDLGRTLEVFAPVEGDNAPTVLLRRKDRTISWCVYANGQEGTRVTELRFESVRNSALSKGTIVLGKIRWTYGYEQVIWRIHEDDGYRYTYSW